MTSRRLESVKIRGLGRLDRAHMLAWRKLRFWCQVKPYGFHCNIYFGVYNRLWLLATMCISDRVFMRRSASLSKLHRHTICAAKQRGVSFSSFEHFCTSCTQSSAIKSKLVSFCYNWINYWPIFDIFFTDICFKFFVLYTNLFAIKIYCQNFITITLLRTIKSMIITPEIKITCTCQVLVFIMVLRQ